MSRFVGFIVGAVEIAAGIALQFLPGGQAIGVSLIISGAATILSSGAALLLAPKQPARNAQEMQLQIGEQPRSIIVGEAMVPGSLVDGFNYGGKYGTDWEVLVIRLADERCHSLTGFYVNDKFETFAGDGPVPGYNGQLEVYFRGDTTNDALPSILTTHGPGWTADDIGGSGCDVTVAYKADAADAKNPVWPGGRPRFQWVVKGGFRYDPRKDSTVAGGSGTHRRDDPSTWEWSDNAIVCRYSWVRGVHATGHVDEPEMLLVGRGLSAVEAPPENVAAAANLCDELVDGEARYRVDGPIYANQQYLEVEEMFAGACAGTVLTREGSVEVEPGQAKAPSFAFTDDDILVGSSVQWNHGILSDADESWVNSVVANYVEPTQQWQAHDAPIRRDSADIAADGKPREGTLTLRLVKRAAQAGACAEVARRLGRLWGRAAVTLGPRFCEIEEGDWGTWTSARRFGGATKTFQVQAYQVDEKWQNRLTLREIASSVFGSVTPIADHAVPGTPSAPPMLAAPGSGAWALTAEQLMGASEEQIPALVITGAPDDDYASAVLFEFRTAGSGLLMEDGGWLLREDGGRFMLEDDTPGEWVSAAAVLVDSEGGPSIRREITGIAPGRTYQVSVRYLVGGEPTDRLILGPVLAGNLVSAASASPVDGSTYSGADVADILSRLDAAGI
jgi:hypothetical protein